MPRTGCAGRFARDRIRRASRPHHRNAVGELFDNSQVMGDEQARESVFGLDFAQQLQHLCRTETSSAEVGSSAITNAAPGPMRARSRRARR